MVVVGITEFIGMFTCTVCPVTSLDLVGLGGSWYAGLALREGILSRDEVIVGGVNLGFEVSIGIVDLRLLNVSAQEF
jgi:hypothetical protein